MDWTDLDPDKMLKEMQSEPPEAYVEPSPPHGEIEPPRKLTAEEQRILDANSATAQSRNATTDAPSVWPDRILHPEGLLGRFADYITATAASPQPLFSLGASLATFGALLGRGVKDSTGQYTNVYAFALGLSNGGKNDPKRNAIQLFDILKRGKVVVEKTCSDSAEEILLSDFPIRFHILDEVGHYFGSMKTAGENNPHLKTVIPMFTDLWSTPTRDGIFTGKSRCPQTGKSWKPPVKIPVPVVSIYATGSPDRLFNALTFDDLTDGAITRYLCFISETFPDVQIHPSAPFPDDLLRDISKGLAMLGLTAEQYSAEGTPPEARTIPETAETTEYFDMFNKQCRNNLRKAAEDNDPPLYLYGKGGENARRAALIHACSRNPSAPCIELVDANFGVGVAIYSICDMIRAVRMHVARNRRERESKEIENVIRKAKIITKSDLTLATRTFDKRDRTSILLDLCEIGIIAEEPVRGRGSKDVTVYRWIGRA